jgi:hypothetical protein
MRFNMKKVASVIASLGMIAGVAVAHPGHAPATQAKADAGFRFSVGTTAGKVKKIRADNCHSHDGVIHCHD